MASSQKDQKVTEKKRYVTPELTCIDISDVQERAQGGDAEARITLALVQSVQERAARKQQSEPCGDEQCMLPE